MGNQHIAILEAVVKYEKSQQGIIIAVFIAALAAVICLAMKQYKQASRSNKIVIWSIIVALCIAFIGYVIYSNSYISKLYSDMENNETITYFGEYTHDDYQKDSFYHNVQIEEMGKTAILRYPDYGNHYDVHADSKLLPSGTHRGRIEYGKNSKIILSWSVDDNIE